MVVGERGEGEEERGVTSEVCMHEWWTGCRLYNVTNAN